MGTAMKMCLLQKLVDQSKKRPAGYLETALDLGMIAGRWFLIGEKDAADFEKLYPRPPGLGDRVERIAKPMARFIDRVAGTDLEHCPQCDERRNALNRVTSGLL